MSELRVTLNGRQVNGRPGQTILELAQANGVDIPTLCHHADLSPIGACRVCVVEVEGAKTLMASCATPLGDGMVIHTHSPRVRKARRTVVDLLLSEHEGDCQYCDRAIDCELKSLG